CTGVDLNRNYSYLWGPAGCGSGASCSQETYRGPSASSELESSSMAALSDQWHFTTAISWHAYGQFIDYPYACSNGAANEIMPEHDVIHEMMHGMADAIDAVDSTPRFDVYSPASGGPISGDDTSWYYAYHGTYAMLVEVGTSFEPNFADVPAIVSRNRAGWQYLYSRLDGARLDVHTTDSATGLPMEATVTLTDYVFDTGELERNTFLPFGRWTYMLPANATYTVQASAAGYATQQQAVAVGAVPAEISIALVADNCGNGAIDSGEECDGANLAGQDCVGLGYLAGTLACGGDCLFDTSACSNSICGNGLIEGSEQCDGSDDAACPGLCIAAGEAGECSCEADSSCTNSDGSRDLGGRPRLKLSGLGDGSSGNEGLLVKGELVLPAGVNFSDINLGSDGLLLTVQTEGGSSLAEVALPSGSYLGTGTRGWRVNGAGTKWKYADKTGSAVGGINKVMLVDRSKKTPGATKLIVKARDGAYPLEQGDEPPLLTVVLGDAAAAAAGLCTESAFVLADCRYNGSATKLSCKQ
ncbi:MAG: M14 family zinc carboxypeptidase, partial [bacterium]